MNLEKALERWVRKEYPRLIGPDDEVYGFTVNYDEVSTCGYGTCEYGGCIVIEFRGPGRSETVEVYRTFGEFISELFTLSGPENG